MAFRTRAGKLAWLFEAPVARQVGSGRPVALRLSLSGSARGVVIHVAPAPASTRARSSAVSSTRTGSRVAPAAVANPSPMVWSGQVVPGDSAYLGASSSTGDCYVDSGSPDTSFCGASTNDVGPTDNTLENFDVANDLPQNVDVLSAYFSMQLASESSTTAETVGAFEAADPWNNAATWDSYDGIDNWSTPGGDTTSSTPTDTQTIGSSGDVGSAFFWDVTGLVQGWADQNPASVDGLIVEATAGSSAPNTLGFESSTGANPPFIDVTYQPREGDYPNAKYDSQKLTTRSTLGVGVANDDLLLSNSDLRLAGVDGLGLTVGRYYNNLSDYQGSFGAGWTMGAGADSYIADPCSSHHVTYFDGTGDGEDFDARTGAAPPGLDMKFSMNAGSAYEASQFTLLARHSGITLTFDTTAGSCAKVAKLASISDRNGNTINYHYNSSGQLSSISDSYGATTTIDWGANGYVSEIIDPSGRTYQYFQNSSGQLTRYQDPAGNSTDYSYDANGNLTQITTPAARTVNIAYSSSDQVTSVQRLVHAGDQTGPQSTYQTAVASGSCPNNQPANAGWMQDSVDDPDGHTTIYCTDSMGRLTGVIDALGHTRSVSYSPDGYVSDLTDQLGIPTAFSYSNDGNDSITAIQYGSGSGALNESFGYSGTSGTANQYLPSSATDTSGNSTSYGYATGAPGSYGAGEPTSITDQLTSQNQATLAYNPDGTVASSTDPDGNQTSYAYTGGNLTKVTPPAGSGLNPVTLSYDAADRVKTISTIAGSPATGHEVGYDYNTLDQITCATYKNAAGQTVATIYYSYDADGNLTKISDPNGDTNYSYDGLDRLTSETFPDGAYVNYSYDPAGNILGVIDPSGEVHYSYDKANELTLINDGPQNRTAARLTYNNDGQLLATTYPSGASDVNSYNTLAQLTKTNDTYKTATGTLAHLTYSYAYSTGGLQSSVTDQAGTATDYSYDALDRLTQASTTPQGAPSPSVKYQYAMDGNGNILTQTISGTGVTGSSTSYAYNPANEICWSYAGSSTADCASPPAGVDSYSYDADGNETSNGNGLSMAYNPLGQMTSATSAGTTTSYSYLGEGQDQLYGIGTSQQIENSLLGVISQGTGNSASTTYYTRATSGQLIDERTPQGTYDYLSDGNGNVIALTDSSGHLVDQYAYDPYGNTTTNTGSIANPFGYQAGYTTSGLIHYGARYLNPAQGSWTQQDPLNHITSLTQNDRYTYAGDNPSNLQDLTGRSFFGDVARGFETVVEGASTLGYAGVNILAGTACEAATEGFATALCAVPYATAGLTLAGGSIATYEEGADTVEHIR